jgi:hypothetical protein
MPPHLSKCIKKGAGNSDNAIPAGASLLAKCSSAPGLTSLRALTLTTIAGKPAPAKDRALSENAVTGKSMKAEKSVTQDCNKRLSHRAT